MQEFDDKIEEIKSELEEMINQKIDDEIASRNEAIDSEE